MVLSVFSGMFALSQFMFFIVFALVIAVFVFVFVSHISRERKNDRSPRITVAATVVAKRTHYSGGSRTGSVHYSGRTRYFVTFQVESGDRTELPVYGEEYGLLAEGDRGMLTFQGTRYISFQRT